MKIATVNFFRNIGNQDHPASDTTFRKFFEGGSYEDVTADFRISSTDGASGSALIDKSQAGNDVLRFNVGISKGAEKRNYYRGTLCVSTIKADAITKAGDDADALKKAHAMPDYFGKATTKDSDVEFEVAGWKVRTSKEGVALEKDKQYIYMTISTPFKKGDADDNEPF